MKTHQEIVQIELRAIRKLLSIQTVTMAARLSLIGNGALDESASELKDQVLELDAKTDADVGIVKGEQ